MIPAMQQQQFYECIKASDYCKLLRTSKGVSNVFVPLSRMVIMSKCHGLKNAAKGKTQRQQCSLNPTHLFADSGIHVCGNHKKKDDTSTIWSIALSNIANFQPKVVEDAEAG